MNEQLSEWGILNKKVQPKIEKLNSDLGLGIIRDKAHLKSRVWQIMKIINT